MSSPKNLNLPYRYRDNCCVCGESSLENIIFFPAIPVADALLTERQLLLPEVKVPLTFSVCTKCFHAQIREVVNPEILFGKNYPYYTGVSPGLSGHFIASAENLIQRFQLDKKSRVVEIASNDGTMLYAFHQHGCVTLGVDPATGPCSVAASKGLKVINDFFSFKLTEEIRADLGNADLTLGNNVLAHVPEPNDFVSGISNLLSEDGNVVIEVPYLLSLLHQVEFDTIFHQHFSYFSIQTVELLFNSHELFLNDAELISIHGGSIRLFFSRTGGETERLRTLKEIEQESGIRTIEVYKEFAGKTEKVVVDLKNMLTELKRMGKTVVGYGAAGKANTLLNVSGIQKDEVLYIADLNTYKQGKYFTGVHLPIVNPSRIMDDMPHYVLILAWNFKDEIMGQLSAYRAKGGKFIIPIPEVKIVE